MFFTLFQYAKVCFLLHTVSQVFVFDLTADDEEYSKNGNDPEDPAERRAEENAVITVVELQRSAEVLFKQGREYKADEQRRNGELEGLKQIANNTEEEHDPNVGKAAVESVNADNAEHEDAGENEGGFQRADLGEGLPGQQSDDDEGQVAEDKTGINVVNGLGRFGEHQRSGSETLNHERTDEQSGTGVAGNAQREQGDHVGAANGVVGGFGSGNAFNISGTEFFRML